MEWISEILSVPFGWVLSLFYSVSHNYLLSLLFLTIIMRLCLLPSAIKQQKGSAKQLRMQSKVNKIKKKYGDDKQKINEETQALYQKEGYNSMTAGCLPLLIQFPVMIGLYGVVYSPLTRVLSIPAAIVEKLEAALQTLPTFLTSIGGEEKLATAARQYEMYILKHFAELKELVPESAAYSATIQRFIDNFQIFGIQLTDKPEFKQPSILWLIPILSGITALMTSVFMQIRQKQTNPDMAKAPGMGCMVLMSPAMSVYFAFLFPTGVGVYWVMSNIISFVQTVILAYTHNPKKMVASLMIDETVEKRSREASIKNLKSFTETSEKMED